MDSKNMYLSMGIREDVYAFGEKIWGALEERFKQIDQVSEYNQLKVIAAMQKNQVSEACLLGTTGYGYNDLGRDTLERVYADIFHTEDALVRPQITCGTHALALALMSNLRPGQELLSPVGKPYDTLEEVIGIRPSKGSLREYGISYRQVDLLPDGAFDYEGIKAAINEKTHLVTIQRSKGYQTRPTLSVKRIGELIAFIKEIKPDVICMVDNCYGEFTETLEPTDVGADLVVGSLIKNPGGGLAPIGGYLAGRRECIENAAYRLTSPGLGKEVGASLTALPAFYQGLFLAPNVTPEPWDMPGYDSPVIMAAGAFVSGSSIELSADGPMKEPYAVYFQGGLTWQHGKFGVLMSLQRLVERGVVLLESAKR